MEQIVISLITLVGVIITAAMGYYTHRHARDVNDAVNHRHARTDENGNTPPKLYDLAINNSLKLDDHTKRLEELQIWKRGYKGSAFPDADAVNGFVDSIEKRINSLEGCRYEPCQSKRKPDCPKNEK
jgi:hypothetical protein